MNVAGAAVGLDDALERRLLVRVAEAGVGPAVEVARPLDVGRGEDRDLLGRVLEDRHDRDDRRAGGRGERQRVLEADAALGLAGGDQRLGRRAGVRQDLRGRRRPRRTSRWPCATKKPVWLVFGVQSSASRTVPSGATGLGDATGDGAADAAGDAVTAEAPAVGGGVADRTQRRRARRPGPRARMRFMRCRVLASVVDLEIRNAVSEERGRRRRVDGPASFAGTSRIRFRGSVALATLSARDALPGGGIRLCRVTS